MTKVYDLPGALGQSISCANLIGIPVEVLIGQLGNQSFEF